MTQRLALLLNLRAGGQAAVALLPLTGVAGIRQIAEVLQMPPRSSPSCGTGCPWTISRSPNAWESAVSASSISENRPAAANS